MKLFYRVYELMLPILIQIYDKRSFHFRFSSNTIERLTKSLQAVTYHIL